MVTFHKYKRDFYLEQKSANSSLYEEVWMLKDNQVTVASSSFKLKLVSVDGKKLHTFLTHYFAAIKVII